MARSSFQEFYDIYGARNAVHHAIKNLRGKDHRSRRKFWREYLAHLEESSDVPDADVEAERTLKTELRHFSDQARARWRASLPDVF